jgi:hypothetical protein
MLTDESATHATNHPMLTDESATHATNHPMLTDESGRCQQLRLA